jgi:hypothetical protein
MCRHTWFWMRSLTRSMGAAAVFETAAETPPTRDKRLAGASTGFHAPALSSTLTRRNCLDYRWRQSCRVGRTQEVDHEALDALLASVVIITASCGVEAPANASVTNDDNSISRYRRAAREGSLGVIEMDCCRLEADGRRIGTDGRRRWERGSGVLTGMPKTDLSCW